MSSQYDQSVSDQTHETEGMSIILQPQDQGGWDEEKDLDDLQVLGYNEISVLEHECGKVMFEEDLLMIDEQGKQIDQVTIAVEEGDLPFSLNVYQYSQVCANSGVSTTFHLSREQPIP